MIDLIEEKKFLRNIWLIPSLIIIFLGFFFFIAMSYKNLIEKQTEFKNMENRIIGKKKEYVKANIDSIINYINFKNKYTEQKLKNFLKEQTNIGYSIIENIYNNNKEKNKETIIKLIKDALRNIRFNHNRGYYFVYDLNKTNILLPIARQLEGKDFSNYKDIKGNPVISDMAKIASKNGEGFYTWFWKKPHTKNVNFNKIGYVKAFKPLHLFIGTGEYINDYIRDLQNETLKNLKFIFLNNLNNKMFILNNNGNVLTTINDNNLNLNFKNINGITLKEKIIEKSKKNGGFIEFKYLNSKKDKIHKTIFYVKTIKNWKWIIVQEINLENTCKQLTANKKLLQKQLYTNIFFIGIFILLLTFIIIKLLKNFSQKTALKFIEYKKESEIEKEKSKMKEAFLANMSHEIRTPLTAILGFVDILKEKLTEKENYKFLITIEKSSHHLLGVINDILDFSKIESGKLIIEKVEFNVIEELKTTIDLFRAKASEKNISLQTDITENTPAIVVSDPLRIKQIISNFLSNAIKFTPNGKKIFVKIYFKNGELCISVKDEGIGIPKDKQEKIFEEFSQADNSTTRKYGGTGLGLSISLKLVKLLNGKINLKSEKEKGSEFYFCIPVEVIKQKNNLIKEKKEINFNDIKINKKILVVEDNKANQMLLKIMLKKMGATIEIANDGLEAVEKFKNNKYDIILMDENMPNMNGIEATKEILKYEKENNLTHTIIIALTANALKDDRERFLNAGMDEYLTKPINKKELIRTLNEFV